MINKLSKHSVVEIAKAVRGKFLDGFLKNFPDLKNKAAVVLIGSIGYGLYDDNSDIDVSVILPENLLGTYKDKIKEYKAELKQQDRQTQLFYNTTFEQLQSLSDWQDDLRLREFAGAIILHDPQRSFKKIQKRIAWYPKDVYREKINWLFAEAVFELSDRYTTAVKRKDPFYGTLSKLKVMQLLMTIVLLLNKEYPIYDKHLYRFQKRLDFVSLKHHTLLKRILAEANIQACLPLLFTLKDQIEEILIAKRLIGKHGDEYWIDLRPKYSVKLK